MSHRYDRTGERVEDAAVAQQFGLQCDRGWVDYDADQLVPCLICRPHLATDPETE